jgi:chromosome segregation ATPase
MIFGLFGQKKEVNKLRDEVQDSFSHVRRDVNKIGDWIKHLDDKKENHDTDIDSLKEEIKTLQEEIKDIKETINFFGQGASKQQTTTEQQPANKQTNNKNSQTNVQTGVQTNDLDKLTVMERAVVWALLNTEMKLSYEDVATLLGKDKSTIRGQINTIRQKIPGIIEELRESNGKKRVFITENTKLHIAKRAKIKIKQ